jgi:hypothetical protein
MDPSKNYSSLEYKECAGKYCENNGINRLRILYINKIGYFCDSCTHQLLALDIVTNEETIN